MALIEDTPTQATVEPPGKLQKALKILAYPAAVAAGWFVVHKQSRNFNYDTLKKRGDFNVLYNEKGEVIGEAVEKTPVPNTQEISKGNISLDDRLNRKFEAVVELADKAQGKDKGNIRKHMRKMLTQNSKEVTGHMHYRGFKWTWEHFSAIPLGPQLEIAFAGVSAAAVSLGVVYAISSKDILNHLTIGGGSKSDAGTRQQQAQSSNTR